MFSDLRPVVPLPVIPTGTAGIRPGFYVPVVLPDWLNRHQQTVIDSLIEENRVLKEQVEGQRLRFTDEQRIRLAVKAKVLGRRLLDEIENLATPDTLQSHACI